jgi:CDP-glucose 4,6-dehydratase
MIYKKYFKNKKVLITGHTGFKGSWLALWLKSLDAKVFGISKSIPTNPSHYNVLTLSKIIQSRFVDIKNFSKLKKTILKFQPDYIFHLAAQSLVKKSYVETLNTWNSNLIGTVNLLEVLKNYNKKKVTVVMITSDKSYKNLEIKRGYKEEDLLGGIDPYGASKSSAELAIKSYVKSFFSSQKNNISIAVARAGNVIGGGDWSEDRLVPDCVRSWSRKKKVLIRKPNSTRPWQHVLESINGYLTLAFKLRENRDKYHGQAFNFGPRNNNTYRVIQVVREMKKNWNVVNWKVARKNKNFFENNLLKLNSLKAEKKLKWRCVLNFKETIFFTIDWYKNFYSKRTNSLNYSLSQIKLFEKLLNERRIK